MDCELCAQDTHWHDWEQWDLGFADGQCHNMIETGDTDNPLVQCACTVRDRPSEQTISPVEGGPSEPISGEAR